MTDILSYFPGQIATVFLETKDGYGNRADGYPAPTVNRIIFPSLTLASGYPQPMTRLDIGLYTFQFTLPVGAVAIGSYLVDVSYGNIDTGITNYKIYQVVCNAAFGGFGITTF